MKVIKSVADNILVLKNGKLIESGNTDEIFNNPKNDYTKTLLSAVI